MIGVKSRVNDKHIHSFMYKMRSIAFGIKKKEDVVYMDLTGLNLRHE